MTKYVTDFPNMENFKKNEKLQKLLSSDIVYNQNLMDKF